MSWQGNHALDKRSWDRIPRGAKKFLECGTFCPGSATQDKRRESRFQNRDKWPYGTGTKAVFVVVPFAPSVTCFFSDSVMFRPFGLARCGGTLLIHWVLTMLTTNTS